MTNVPQEEDEDTVTSLDLGAPGSIFWTVMFPLYLHSMDRSVPQYLFVSIYDPNKPLHIRHVRAHI